MAKKEANKDHLKRPSWLTRLSATTIDFCICLAPFLIFGIDVNKIIEIFAVLMAVYYYLFESTIGTSPGKFLFRLKMLDTKGQKASKSRVIVRILLRFGTVFMMLSWKRITLLDLLSGCRIEKVDGAPPPLFKKGPPKKIQEKTTVMGWR